MFQLRSRLIRVGALLVAAGFFEGLPVSAQEAYGEKELTFPLEIEGDHSVSVHLFSVLVPGTLRAEVTWEVSPRREGRAAAGSVFYRLSRGCRHHPGIGGKFVANATTGAGKRPLGFGWNHSLPPGTRKTGKGLAQCRETPKEVTT
jgi:hypothetical protein